MSEARLEAWLEETRSFPPSEEFAKQANAQPSIYAEADADTDRLLAQAGRSTDVGRRPDEDTGVGSSRSPNGLATAN